MRNVAASSGTLGQGLLPQEAARRILQVSCLANSLCEGRVNGD